MAEYSAEEYALGFEDCRCDGLAVDANYSPCAICAERVKFGDHVHYKGGLYHDWCLLIAALKQSAAPPSVL